MLTRVDFNAQDFEDFIQQKGLRLQWDQNVRCPCIDPKTEHAVDGCPQCNGRGRFYYSSQSIKGLVTRQNKEFEIGDAMGVLEPGRAYLTTPSRYKLTLWDRITNLDSTAIYTETLIHLDRFATKLQYIPVGDVQFAAMQATRTSNITVLKQHVDFDVDSTGTIKWISVNKPADNTGVSFRYEHHPIWLVTDVPNYVRDTFIQFGNVTDTATALPLRVEIRLQHLIPSQK